MQMLLYSGAGIIATLSIFILHYHLLFSLDNTRERIAYKRFLFAILAYFVTDVVWGVAYAMDQKLLLNIDTIANYFCMTVAVILCYHYIMAFLHIKSFMRRHAMSISIMICVLIVTFLIVNWFYPLFFLVDEALGYQNANFRDVLVIIQVSWFLYMTFMSFQTCRKSSDDVTRKRNGVIVLFGVNMVVFSILQWLLPLFPMNTMGFCFGALFIHVFIHEEDEQFKMKKIQQLNAQLSANHDVLKALYEKNQQQAEQHRTELSRLKNMLESTGIGTWQLIVKEGARVRLATDAKMKELMGITYMNMTEEDACDFLMARINPEDIPAFMEYDRRLRTGERCEVSYRWSHPLLGERYLRCGGVAITTTEGTLCNGYHLDITDQILKEQELSTSIAANKAKTRFLHNMSHEIRTPLNAMFGFSQLLGMPDGSWSEEEKENYNKYIYNSYNMMDMLINDILDIADSDHGNYQISISDVHVNSMCQFAIMSVEYRCPGDVELKFSSEVDDKFTIKSDGRRIQQVLVNYLTNACKNTEKGEILLHCSTSEKPGHITFSVTDTGKGVPAEEADRIFGRFTKLDRHAQGSGLGLNICYTIAKKLNGEVYLDTSYTKGARFVFVL